MEERKWRLENRKKNTNKTNQTRTNNKKKKKIKEDEEKEKHKKTRLIKRSFLNQKSYLIPCYLSARPLIFIETGSERRDKTVESEDCRLS